MIAINNTFPCPKQGDCRPSFDEFKAMIKKGKYPLSSNTFITNEPNYFKGGYIQYSDMYGVLWDSGPGFLQNGTFTIEDVKVGSVEKQEVIIYFKIRCELFRYRHTDRKFLEIKGKIPLSNLEK